MANRRNRLQKLVDRKKISTDALGVIWGCTQQNAVQKLKYPATRISLQEYVLLAIKLNVDLYELIKVAVYDTN